MSGVKKADKDTMKILNRQIILDCIRKNGEMSRIDLAKYSKLSPTTVSSIISDLMEERLVTEIRVGESNGGRKPLMVGINSSAKHVVTAVITQKGVEFALVDLNFKITGILKAGMKAEGGEALVNILVDGIRELLAKYHSSIMSICGICISIPGVVDHHKGKVLYSSKFHMKEMELASVIEEKTGFKTFVFKDTDALLLGEYNFVIKSTYENIIYITTEGGIGMSYINSGKLFHPGYGGGFELGHLIIDSNGPVCRCGNRGCLGAFMSDAPVLNKLGNLIGKGYETDIRDDISQMSLMDIVNYSNKGDKAAIYVLEEQARILGTALASVINLFNPQLLVIGGPLSNCKWGFMDIVKGTVKDRALEIYSRNLEIRTGKPGEESALLGMANEIFEQEVYKKL